MIIVNKQSYQLPSGLIHGPNSTPDGLRSEASFSLTKHNLATTMFCRLTFFYTSTCYNVLIVYHQLMVVIPVEKAFASHSYTVVSTVHVTHDDPLSTIAAYS